MTTIHHTNRDELLARRAAILARLETTDDDFKARVQAGGLVGAEWDAWGELQNIEYLLGVE